MMTLFTDEYIWKAYGHEQREEGREEGRDKVVLGLKAQNVSEEIIAKAAGITVEEVQAILQRG